MPNVKFKAQAFKDLDNTLLGIGTIIDQGKVQALLSPDRIDFGQHCHVWTALRRHRLMEH